MLQTEIKRINLKPVLSEDEPTIPTLAAEAAEVLGYTSSAGSTLANPNSNALLKALRKLDIDVLDWRDVKRYQLKKRHEADLRLLEEDLRRDSPETFPTTAAWGSTNIEKYRGHIPEFVLYKAIQLKKELPDCRIEIESLSESRDPLLKVSIKKEDTKYDWYRDTYYIEVWDEPEFERL